MRLLLSTVLASLSSLLVTFSLFLHRLRGCLVALPTSPCLALLATLHLARQGEAKLKMPLCLVPFPTFLDMRSCMLSLPDAVPEHLGIQCLPSSRVTSPVSICFSADSHRFPLHPWLSPSYNGFLFQGWPLAASSLL